MKIYSATQTQADKIKQYIGKDVWVYCKCKAHCLDWERSHPYGYIRFLDIYETDGYGIYVEINAVSRNEIENGKVTLYTLSDRVRCSIRDVTPFFDDDYVYTTEELFGEMVSVDNTKLINLSNKGYWVMVRDKSQGSYANIMYIRIRSIVDKYVTYDYINADMVDYCRGATDDDDFGIPPSEQIYEGHAYLNAFEIYEPLEILSDLEMEEVLAYSDGLQQEAFSEERDGENE